MLQNNVNYTFPKSRYAKDYVNVKLVYLPSCRAAQMFLMLDMISKNSDFGVCVCRGGGGGGGGGV